MRKFERRIRRHLLGTSVCWGMLALSTHQIGLGLLPWFTELTAVLSVAAALCGVVLMIRPANRVAYRYGAPAAVGALLAQAVAAYVFLRQLNITVGDLGWTALAQVALTLLLADLYVNWWLIDVRKWHNTHRALG